MLLVDPMKRVTIPEIRQHPWFLNHLPRYLAVPPPDTTQQAKRVRAHYNLLVYVLLKFMGLRLGSLAAFFTFLIQPPEALDYSLKFLKMF